MSATLTLLALGGPAGDAFAAAAGVAAAVLLLGGPIALRAQRQRHQFLLTRAALEHGVTQLPPGPPAWLQSARTGWVLLTLASWCALIDLWRRPFHWGTTRHGLTPRGVVDLADPAS